MGFRSLAINIRHPIRSAMEGMWFADAHLHVTETGLSERYPDIDDAGILFGCTARPSEWDALTFCRIPGTVRFYGVHPWYSDEWNGDVAQRLAFVMESDQNAHVGEIGLDSKRGNLSDQTPAFVEQLDLASRFGRVVNIHMIGCEKEVLDALRAHAKGCRAIVLHSFSSESYMKPFAEIGCMFSINPRILARSNARLVRLMSSIPEDRLLLETDAPYVPKDFSGMRDFAHTLAERTGSDGEGLMRLALDNARRITDV